MWLIGACGRGRRLACGPVAARERLRPTRRHRCGRSRRRYRWQLVADGRCECRRSRYRHAHGSSRRSRDRSLFRPPLHRPPRGAQVVVVRCLPSDAVLWSTQRRLLRVLRRSGNAVRRQLGPVTLAGLENPRRPLLFSLLPRMLRGDGSAPKSLQAAFEYVDQYQPFARASPVSAGRWRRALATSRRLAARRAAQRCR
jgi:hypothetical protein